jgi:hypothetical protein
MHVSCHTFKSLNLKLFMIKTIIKLKYHKSSTTVQKPILKASRMKNETNIQTVP